MNDTPEEQLDQNRANRPGSDVKEAAQGAQQDFGWLGNEFSQKYDAEGNSSNQGAAGITNKPLHGDGTTSTTSAAGLSKLQARISSLGIGTSFLDTTGKGKATAFCMNLAVPIVGLAGVFGLFNYISEVVRSFGSNIFEGVAALLLAWLAVPILMIGGAILAAILIGIAMIIDAFLE